MKKLLFLSIFITNLLLAQMYTAEGDGLVKIYEEQSGVSGNYLIITGYTYALKYLKIHNQEISLKNDDFTLLLRNKNLPESLKIRAITKTNELIEGQWLVPKQEIYSTETVVTKKHKKSFNLYAGLKPWSYNYKETLDAPLKSTEFSNSLLNVFGGLTFYDPGEMFFLNAELDLGSAKTHYDGSYQNGDPLQDTTDNSWFDAVCKGGAQLNWGQSKWSAYTGLGLYSWTRVLGNGDGYKEVYSWFYLPLGFSMDYYFLDNFSVGVDAGIKQMLAGNIGIWFDPDSTGDADLNLILGNRTGYYYSLPLKLYIDDFNFTCAPYFESRPIGKSNTGEYRDSYYIYTVYEPSSTAYISGVKFLAGYSF